MKTIVVKNLWVAGKILRFMLNVDTCLILLQTTELFLLNAVDTRVACYALYFVKGIHCAVNDLFFVHYKSLTCMLK